VRTREIRRLNGLPYGRTLHLDQEVLIPLAKVSLDTFEERRYEHHKRIQEDFFAAYRAVEKTPYRVRTGDTVWGLCRERFDIPVWLLQHFNPDADLAALRAGQLLQIPTVEKTDGGDPGTVTDDTESGIGVDASG
jgi:membrane-bound lytic murein transglycosylase D